MVDQETVKKMAGECFEAVVQYRRHLHAHPELSYQEYETAKYVANILRDAGIPYETKAETGVVAYIYGQNPDQKVIALRADMDALPIQENNQTDYASQNAGVMHACGHDVHTASMLGAARILHECREQFEGTIKILFQPGEEETPGGANLMIRDKALTNPEPEVIIGQHVLPEMEVGKVGFKAGKYMASSDEIKLTVQGKGGHAAMPSTVIDPVLMASHIVVGLQQIVSRNADPTIPSVLSFGYIEGKGANNVIPDQVKLEGTFRTFDEEWRGRAHEKIRQMAKSIAQGMGGDCEVEIITGYPTLYNAEELTQRARHYAEQYMGKEAVEELPLRATAEDFAFYSQYMPASFYRLGVGNPQKGINNGLHTSRFDIDEEALKTGMGLMAFIALQELENTPVNHE